MAVYQKIHISTVLKHYKQPHIQQALVNEAGNKEIAVSYGGTGYGKRPDMLKYPGDVLEMVKQGATSFHCSEELWNNPLQVTTGMKPEELSELRIGWDLLLDIDCPELEYSKIAGDLLVHALKHEGIVNPAVKFSGNHGFHIGVPWEAFPPTINGTPTKNLFPDGPRRIAAYLQYKIGEHLQKKLLQMATPTQLAEKTGKTLQEITKKGQLDPFAVLSIDTVLIASRHLYRMPYSLNEKSGLCSVVIKPEEILGFTKDKAKPELVKETKPFLVRTQTGEGRKLLMNAFDFKPKIVEERTEIKRVFQPLEGAVPEQYFPPCIQKINQGLVDGKKRALLILINFLSSVGWGYDQIEHYIFEWNKKNKEPLRDVYINGQLRYAKQGKAKLPPNCDNKAYMVALGVCQPDNFCGAQGNPGMDTFTSRIKNPANYSIKKQRNVAREQEKGKKVTKNTDETPSSKPL